MSNYLRIDIQAVILQSQRASCCWCMPIQATSSVMEDQMDSWASSKNRNHLKMGGCISIFSQLFDWNRVLGSKPFATRLLVPDVTSSHPERAVVIGKPVILNTRKRTGQRARRQKEYDHRESMEASLTHLTGTKASSCREDMETPKELRQLLHVKQEPFVLEDLLQEKRQPTRRRDAEMNVRAGMKADQNSETTRCQNSKRSKVGESRKYQEDGDKASAVPKTPAQRRKVPAESIISTPSSQVRCQFAEMASLSLSRGTTTVVSPGKNPVKSPNKKALLMETAAKILEGSNRSRKPSASMRPLLLEKERKNAFFESKPSKKTSKLMPMRRALSERQDRARNIVAETQSERANTTGLENERIFYSKKRCGSSERVGIDIGKPDTTTCGRKLDSDSTSVKMLADEIVQETRSTSPSKIQLHFCHERRKNEDAVNSLNPTSKVGDAALLRSFLRRKVIATSSSAGRISCRMAVLVTDVAGASVESASVNCQHSERCACGRRRLHSGLWTDDAKSPKHGNGGIPLVAGGPESDLDEHGCFASSQISEDSSFTFSPSSSSEAEGDFSQMNQRMETVTDDSKIGETVEPTDDNGFAKEGKSYSGESAGVRSTRCREAPEIDGRLARILKEIPNLDVDGRLTKSVQNYDSAVPGSPAFSDISKDGGCNDLQSADTLQSAQRTQVTVTRGTWSMLKLCDFSWWERDLQSEEDRQAQQDSRGSRDQLMNDSEEYTSNDSVESPTSVLRISGENTDGTSLEGDPPTTSDLTCMDEQQFSPVSVLDAAFEEDFPTLDEPFASFQEARKVLLDNVRRYELLSKMDLETLMTYAEIDSSVDEAEDSSMSSIEKGWDADNINSDLQNGKEYSGVVEQLMLENGDESSICLVETGPWLCCESEVERETFLAQVEDEGIRSSEWATANFGLVERLQKGKRLSCKLFCDCVAEALAPRAEGKASNMRMANAWIMVPANLRQELRNPVPSELSLADALVEIDLECSRSRWVDSGKEVEELETDIESTVFGVLMNELVAELMEGL